MSVELVRARDVLPGHVFEYGPRAYLVLEIGALAIATPNVALSVIGQFSVETDGLCDMDDTVIAFDPDAELVVDTGN